MNDPQFSIAFQPIVRPASGCVVAYEALLRGPHGESAASIFAQVSAGDRYQFDGLARARAIAVAARLGLTAGLTLNCLPGSLHAATAAVDITLDAARQHHLGAGQIILEVTESEVIEDHAAFAGLIDRYRGLGLRVAIDDFGAGYAGLGLLADFQPDLVKLDMNLVRGIEHRGPRQAIVRAVMQVCFDLGIEVIAEGVETAAEYRWFAREGVELYQGYYFARPAFEQLATWSPADTGAEASLRA